MSRCRFVTADDLDLDEVLDLYASVGWSAYTREPARLRAALAGSHRVVVARAPDGDGAALVGLARSISDGATIVYLQDILVRPAAQRTGLGRELVQTLLSAYPGLRQQVLITDTEPGQRAFYESLGLTEAHDMSPGLRAFVRLSG